MLRGLCLNSFKLIACSSNLFAHFLKSSTTHIKSVMEITEFSQLVRRQPAVMAASLARKLALQRQLYVALEERAITVTQEQFM